MFSATRLFYKRLVLVFVLFLSHLYCIALSVYQFPPFQMLQKIKRIVIPSQQNRVIHSRPYYLQKVSGFSEFRTSVPIVMVGDSITDDCEWVELVPQYRIANRGIRGDTTAGVLSRLDQIISLGPRKVFLMIGINDILRQIPVSQIEENYRKIISALLANKIEVFVQSTLYVGKARSHLNHRVKELNELVSLYCMKNGIQYVDLNIVLSPNGFLLDEYSNDGIHLLGAGYAKWKYEIVEFMK